MKNKFYMRLHPPGQVIFFSFTLYPVAVGHSVLIRTLWLHSFRWILEALRVEWWYLTPCFASLPERENENIKWFISSIGNRTHSPCATSGLKFKWRNVLHHVLGGSPVFAKLFILTMQVVASNYAKTIFQIEPKVLEIRAFNQTKSSTL